jgi:argininosuccinate lyase
MILQKESFSGENKDVRNNIVEALVERVEEPARKLNTTISQYAQNLTILRLWFHDSAYIIITLIEQLQVHLCSYFLFNFFFLFL